MRAARCKEISARQKAWAPATHLASCLRARRPSPTSRCSPGSACAPRHAGRCIEPGAQQLTTHLSSWARAAHAFTLRRHWPMHGRREIAVMRCARLMLPCMQAQKSLGRSRYVEQFEVHAVVRQAIFQDQAPNDGLGHLNPHMRHKGRETSCSQMGEVWRGHHWLPPCSPWTHPEARNAAQVSVRNRPAWSLLLLHRPCRGQRAAACMWLGCAGRGCRCKEQRGCKCDHALQFVLCALFAGTWQVLPKRCLQG